MTGEGYALAFFAAVIAAAVGAHAGLRRLARRLPRWLARRRAGVGIPGTRLPWERSIAAGCLALRAGVWLVALRVLADRFWVLRGLQSRVGGLVDMGLASPLFALGERTYSTIDLVTLAALLAVVWGTVGLLARTVRRHLGHFAPGDRGVEEAVTVVFRVGASLLGTIVVLQAWGIDMSSLTIVASVLGVGLGFGLQNIANNFVSGLLLTFERPIKPGDFVQVGELMGTVERIGARSTEVRTLDRVSILVPNSRLLEQEVVNWSHGDPVSRIHVPVSIEYGADLRRARAAMLDAAQSHPEVLADPRPAVELKAFGENGIELDLLVWTREPRRQAALRSELNFRVFEAFARHGVTIPYPQQDVHLHAPWLEAAVAALVRRHLDPAAPVTDREVSPPPAAVPPFDGVDASSPSEWSDTRVDDLVERLRGAGGVAIADRRHFFTVHPRCFIGREAVDWLMARESLTREEAVAAGRMLVERGRVHHVLDEHGFEDDLLFYRFRADEPAAGAVTGTTRRPAIA